MDTLGQNKKSKVANAQEKHGSLKWLILVKRQRKNRAVITKRMRVEQTLWGNLPLLVRSNSKDSVEYILQALWRTRKTGLDPSDRIIIRDMLQLQNDSDLDPVTLSLFLSVKVSNFFRWIFCAIWFFMQLLVCLRMLIRRCVYENINRDEIQNLFPDEVLPELQRLLTLLLQKFQREWREDAMKDQDKDKLQV